MSVSPISGFPLRRLESLCRRYHVETLYVFGSRAGEICGVFAGEGGLKPERSSDVDIGVRLSMDRTPTVRDKVEFALALEDLLGVDRVDLVVLSEADPFLAVSIIRGERLFCKDDYQADGYELYVLRRAGDLAAFERLRIGRIMESADLS